jgi:hypothetical protein
MGTRWKTQRHEDRYCKGIPDRSFAVDKKGPDGAVCRLHGWMELKYQEFWPKHAGSALKLEHFTKEQKLWLHTFGHRCFFLLQVENTWLLFDHTKVLLIGSLSKRGLEENCVKLWVGHPNPDELLKLLSA